MSLKKQLIIYLKNRREYISKAEIEQFGESLGFLGDNVARRCRELQNEGVFERKKQGKSIAYKYHIN
ncbi:MAG: hypothetical protein BWY74_00827 [Firmicutes bacterium ADurb.Bin419]|nr:MAG: hypothetical protein BWY74_00827 [Firmicutes bacterium ADurb.Bin419]